jgi:hypothetical protein
MNAPQIPSRGEKQNGALTVTPQGFGPQRSSPRGEGEHKEAPLTADGNNRVGPETDSLTDRLCAFCRGPIPATRRRDSRFCRDSHRVAAFQRAKRERLNVNRVRARRTRRVQYPNWCWRFEWGCLSRDPSCTCGRCRHNICDCVEIRVVLSPRVSEKDKSEVIGQ